MTGRMTLRPDSIVHSVSFDPRTREATGVRVIDAETGATMQFRSRVIFLCASALESVRILFNSATSEFSDGLANSSGELGHNLMDHVKGGGATATILGHEDQTVAGRRPNGIYVPRFRNVKTRQSGFLRGYGFLGGGHREGWERGTAQTAFGPEFKKAMHRAGARRFTL